MRGKMYAACLAVLCGYSTSHAVVVTPGESGAGWLGYMNVFETNENGGAFVFGSPWGVPDLVATFDDANDRVTFATNNIGDPNPFWYLPSGGPGAVGNKVTEANMYVEVTDTFAGQTVTFEGTILSNTFTSEHTATIFIRDFDPTYLTFNEVSAPAVAGSFSLSLATDAGAGRHVQYGFQVKGRCVWVTDASQFGNMVISTASVPTGPTCDSIDFNNDSGVFDPTDIDAFLSVFSEGPCIPEAASCNDIDFNNDGSLFDPCDIDAFLLVFSEGPCTLCGV